MEGRRISFASKGPLWARIPHQVEHPDISSSRVGAVAPSESAMTLYQQSGANACSIQLHQHDLTQCLIPLAEALAAALAHREPLPPSKTGPCSFVLGFEITNKPLCAAKIALATASEATNTANWLAITPASLSL